MPITINPEDCRDILCPRCKRWTQGWPLQRGNGNRCSPKEWTRCIREPQTIIDEMKRKEVIGAK